MSQNMSCRFRMPNATSFAYPFPMIQIPQNPNARLRVFLPFMPNMLLQNNDQNSSKANSDGVDESAFLPFIPDGTPLQNSTHNSSEASNLNHVDGSVFLPFTPEGLSLQNDDQDSKKADTINGVDGSVFLPFTPNRLRLQNSAQNQNKSGNLNDLDGRVFLPFTSSSLFLQNDSQNLNKANNSSDVDGRLFLPFTSNSLPLQTSTTNASKARNLNDVEGRLFLPFTPNNLPLQNQNNSGNQNESNNSHNSEERALTLSIPNSQRLQSNTQQPNAVSNLSDAEEIVPDFKCEICDCRIPTYSEFMRHKTSHEDADYNSSSSESSSDDSLFLELAKGKPKSSAGKDSNGTDATVFSCPYCERIFKHRSGLEKHIGTHNTTRKFACPICESTFTLDSSLRKHQMMVHGTTKVRRHCPYCTYRCFQSSDMEKHVARKHTGNFKFKCALCSKGFTTPKELNNHVRRNHPNVKFVTINNAARKNFGAKVGKFYPTVEDIDKVEKFTKVKNSSRRSRKIYPILKPYTSITMISKTVANCHEPKVILKS